MDLIIVTDRVNRGGRRVLPQGVDLTNYLKNPILLENHDVEKGSIGRLENIRVMPDKIVGTPVFDEETEGGKRAKRQMDEGFLYASSIAYYPKQTSSDPEDVLPGQLYETVTRSDLFEVSIVPVPLDGGAVLERQSFYEQDGGQIPLLKQSNPKPKIMENKLVVIGAALGLGADATSDQILQSINKLKADHEKATTEVKTLRQSAIDSLLAEGERKGVVTEENKAHYQQLAEQSYESVKALIDVAEEKAPDSTKEDGLQESLTQKMVRQGLKDSSQKGGDQDDADRSKWTYDDWSKNDPKGLFQIKQSNDEEYKRLVAERKKSRK